MARESLEHLSQVERALNTLPPLSAFAFAASCMERQLVVYECAVRGAVEELSGRSLLRESLDRLWRWLSASESSLSGASESCEAVLSYVESLTDTPWVMAHTVAHAFYDQLNFIEAGEHQNAVFAAQTCITLIDDFLYEISGKSTTKANDAWVDTHAIMQEEIARQNEDLRSLRDSPMPGVIGLLSERSRNVSVLGDCWFPKEV